MKNDNVGKCGHAKCAGGTRKYCYEKGKGMKLYKEAKRDLEVIHLAGFGDFSENEDDLIELKQVAEKHHVACNATYYDHELVGTRDAIEAVTQDMWGMPRDQWEDNGLTVIDIA